MNKTSDPQSLIRQAAAVTEERAEDPADQIRFVRKKIDTSQKRLFLKLLVPLSVIFAVMALIIALLRRG